LTQNHPYVVGSSLMSSDPENELIARCRKGDSLAWNRLFDEHYVPTARFVFQLDPHFLQEDVEEICQETFLSVIKNIVSFQGNSRLQTWIFRIASNKARDYRQRLGATKRGGGQSVVSLQAPNPETGLVPDPPTSVPGPDETLLCSERAQLVGRGLDGLGEPCREIIELRYFGDLSYEEISVELKLNPKTVSSRLSKCLDNLQEIMKTLFEEKKTSDSPSN